MKNALITALSMAGSIAMPQQSSAIVITATYSGTVERAFDRTGLFGPAMTVLTGNYSAAYTYDTRTMSTYPGENYISGGSSPDEVKPSPTIAIRFTINGMTINLKGDFVSRYLGYNNGNTSQQSHFAEDRTATADKMKDYRVSSLLDDAYFPSIPSSLDKVFTYQVGDRQSVYGDFFEFYEYDFVADRTTVDTYGRLHPMTLSYSIAAVPEPATWSMLITGFLLVGVPLRRANYLRRCEAVA